MIKISPFTPLFFSPSTDIYGTESRYIQMFSPDDKIVIQVITDEGESVYGTLNNVVSESVEDITFETFEMASSVVVHTAVLTALPDGFYTADVCGSVSEVFRVYGNVSELKMTSLISYTSYTNKLRSDVAFWNDTVQYEFQFRVPGGFKDGDWGFEVNNEQFETGDGNIIELFAVESTQKMFTMGNAMGCPIWFGDMLNRILCCTHVHINGVRYVRKGNSTPEVTQELPALKSYIFKVSLQGMVENVNIELPSSDDDDPESGGGGAGYVYLIRMNDTTKATDSNTYSALRMIYEIDGAIKANNEKLTELFLGKTQDDETPFNLGVGSLNTIGAILSMLSGKGTLIRDGLIQTDRLEVRNSMTVMEIIFNRLSAMESNYAFSAAASIESVELRYDSDGNPYYRLTFRKRWENDFHAFAMNDILYGQFNDLATGGRSYYTSWMRVLEYSDTTTNQVDVVLWSDEQVPGGVNYPPSALMNLIHRGNTTDTDRQSYWYLSAMDEKCLVWLEGVDAPILREENYYMILGKLKNLSIFDNLPLNYSHSYMYARGAIVQELFRVDFQGVVQKTENNRGAWSAAVAASENPYKATDTSFDTVWHHGCKWQCLVSGTLQEPCYAATDWTMVEGDPNYYLDFDSSMGWQFFRTQVNTVITAMVSYANEDITSTLMAKPSTTVVWSRDSGDVTDDNTWSPTLVDGQPHVIHLTVSDMGPNWGVTNRKVKFTCTVYIQDGDDTSTAENSITI